VFNFYLGSIREEIDLNTWSYIYDHKSYIIYICIYAYHVMFSIYVLWNFLTVIGKYSYCWWAYYWPEISHIMVPCFKARWTIVLKEIIWLFNTFKFPLCWKANIFHGFDSISHYFLCHLKINNNVFISCFIWIENIKFIKWEWTSLQSLMNFI
jgi:hypothetical protein